MPPTVTPMHPGSGRRRTAVALATIMLVAGFTVVVGPSAAGAREEHALGVTTRTFEDSSRSTPRNGDAPKHPGRTLETTIWYPAVGGGSDAPDAAGGPYPLIVFAHGYSATPEVYEGLLGKIAATGYVVAAPTFPLSSGGGDHTPDAGDVVNQPADVSFVIDKLLAASRAKDGSFADMIDPKAIGVAGHSNGGITTLGIAAHSCCRDTRVKAVASLSGTPAPYPDGKYDFTRMPPFLAIHGTADTLVAYDDIVRTFNQARGPKVLLTIEGGDHGSSASISDPASGSVLGTLLDFFDGYLRGDQAAIAHLADNAEPGLTSIDLATAKGSRAKIPVAPKVHYDREVTVTPTKNLSDGDVVTLRWTGFSPAGGINVLQCGPDRSSGSAGCDLTSGALLHPDPTGEGEVQITVIEGPVGDQICDAKHPPCVILANDDSSLDPSWSVEVKIHFKKQ